MNVHFVNTIVQSLCNEISDKECRFGCTKSVKLICMFILAASNGSANGRSACTIMISSDIIINNELSKVQMTKLFSLYVSLIYSVKPDILPTACNILHEIVSVKTTTDNTNVRTFVESAIIESHGKHRKTLFIALILIGLEERYSETISCNFTSLLAIVSKIDQIDEKRDTIRYCIKLIDDIQKDMRSTGIFNDSSRCIIEKIVKNLHSKI